MKKLFIVILQILLGVILISVGLYNCTVNGIDPLWVSLIVLPVSIFLPHPQAPVRASSEDNGVDVPDGLTSNTLHRRHLRHHLPFIVYVFICLTIATVGICCLLILDDRWRTLWIALITLAVGCLVPTPFILLR